MKPSIQKCIQALRAGQPVLLTLRDDSGATRGALILAAENATPAGVNLLALEGRGVVCVGIDAATARRLDLSPMVQTADAAGAALHSVSTISIDAKHGTTTGISAGDRAVTLRLLTSEEATADDFIRPGHLFPYVAHEHGVLGRAEMPEAAVDLMRLAGLKPAGAFCGVLDRSGRVADAAYLQDLASRQGIATVGMDELVAHRLLHGRYLQPGDKEPLASDYGTLEIQSVRDTVHDDTHHVVSKKPGQGQTGIVYVHRACIKEDVFGARDGAGRRNLAAALRRLAAEGGLVIYLGPRTPAERGPSIAAQLVALNGLRAVRPVGPDAAGLPALLEQVGVSAAAACGEGAVKEAIAIHR